MQDFNFYKVNETLNHKYYQIPQELFINPLYKNALNSDSKLLYGFLLDRLSEDIEILSEFFDVFIIFLDCVFNLVTITDKSQSH